MEHTKEFEIALQRLRGKDADVSQEAADIQEYIEEVKSLPKARFLDLFQHRYIRSVIVGVGLMVLQQLGGINGIEFSVSETFVSAVEQNLSSDCRSEGEDISVGKSHID